MEQRENLSQKKKKKKIWNIIHFTYKFYHLHADETFSFDINFKLIYS